MEEAAKALTNLSATIFSPAKMVYIAYVVLTYFKIPKDQPWWTFYAVSVVFLGVEIFHNDWGRIQLNYAAEKHRPEWLRPTTKRD